MHSCISLKLEFTFLYSPDSCAKRLTVKRCRLFLIFNHYPSNQSLALWRHRTLLSPPLLQFLSVKVQEVVSELAPLDTYQHNLKALSRIYDNTADSSMTSNTIRAFRIWKFPIVASKVGSLLASTLTQANSSSRRQSSRRDRQTYTLQWRKVAVCSGVPESPSLSGNYNWAKITTRPWTCITFSIDYRTFIRKRKIILQRPIWAESSDVQQIEIRYFESSLKKALLEVFSSP